MPFINTHTSNPEAHPKKFIEIINSLLCSKIDINLYSSVNLYEVLEEAFNSGFDWLHEIRDEKGIPLIARLQVYLLAVEEETGSMIFFTKISRWLIGKILGALGFDNDRDDRGIELFPSAQNPSFQKMGITALLARDYMKLGDMFDTVSELLYDSRPLKEIYEYRCFEKEQSDSKVEATWASLHSLSCLRSQIRCYQYMIRPIDREDLFELKAAKERLDHHFEELISKVD
ncbi:hypothetical protein N9Z83_02605 [Akkermansiaceae bacterium]|nr:hypothetical protein [Akkermansiaceae bacterium]